MSMEEAYSHVATLYWRERRGASIETDKPAVSPTQSGVPSCSRPFDCHAPRTKALGLSLEGKREVLRPRRDLASAIARDQ